MLIAKINRMADRHRKIALFVIGLIMAVPFVFFWGPSSNLFSVSRYGRGSVGRMYGRRIKTADYLHQMRAAEVGYAARSGQWLHEDGRFAGMLHEEALNRMRLLHEAKRRGLDKVSRAEVEERVRETFSGPDGFNKEVYQFFVQRRLPQIGFSEKDYLDVVRDDIAVGRLTAEAAAKVFVAPAEVRERVVRDLESYLVEQAPFRGTDYLAEAQLTPSDDEVETHYREHQSELTLPDLKRVKVAEFASEAYGATVEISAAQTEAYFAQNKARYEKQEKTLDQARTEIETLLRRREGQGKALEAAQKLAGVLTDRYASPPAPDAAVAAFDQACAEAGVTARAVGPFSKYGVVEGIKASERFTEAAYALGPENPFSGLIYDGNSYLVACWVETVPGAKAESLTPELRGKIKDALLAAKARAFYQQNVESYRAFLRTGLSPDELKTHLADGSLKGLLPDAKLDMPPAEFNRGIDTYVRPYYVAPEKRVRVVAFEAAAYRDKIGDITAADLEAYYADHKSDYEEQVKASHILVRVKEDAKDDEKAAARTKAEGIRDRIVKGADFAAVARAESEDTGSGFQGGDLGFFGRGKMVKPFEDAAFALEKEALSELVETPFGLHIIKVTDRKPARTLDEAAVTEEVRGKVGDERAKQLAMKAAGDFAYGVYEYTEEPGAGQSVAQAFGDYATKDGRAFQDTGWFGQYGGVEPFLSADLAAGREAFKVSAKQPVSTVIEGDGRYFVVCLLDEKAGYLPEFSEQRQALVTQVLGQMRNEESVRVARQKAREAHAAIVAALAEGKAFDTLKAAYRFGGVDAFTLKSPPRAAFSDVIVATVPTLAVGTLSEPQETPTGAVLVYLRERVAPGDKAIQEKLAETEAALLREKQQAALQEFLKRLEEDSGTRLKEGVAGSAAL